MTAASGARDTIVDVKRCPQCGTGFGLDAAFCPFDGIALKKGTWSPNRDPRASTVVDRRYEIIAPLGEGGMGTVYRVRHVTLDRLFAMKVLRSELAKDAGLAARFMQEAKATAAIRHPSIVAINDFGELEDGAPYFVMELLAGETLSTYLKARGLLAPRVAASIARQIADGLAAAHGAGVIHRDLKPENVFLVGGATGKSAAADLRIVDFGAAKIVGASQLTRPGVVFGTPHYMSPEQASGEPVDQRSDIYSLGVLIYEMTTGTVPFEAATHMGVLKKHMFETPARPSQRKTGVQLDALEEIVLRALEKDPQARFASMTELSNALRAFLANRAPSPSPSPSSRPPGSTERMVAFPERSTADRIQSSVTRQVAVEEGRRKRWLAAVVTVGVVGLLGLSAVAMSIAADDPRKIARPTRSNAGVGGPPALTAASAVPAVASGAGAASVDVASGAGEVEAPVVVASPPTTVRPSSAVAAPPRPPPPPPPTPEVAPRPAPAAARPSPAPAVSPPSRPSDEFGDPWKKH